VYTETARLLSWKTYAQRILCLVDERPDRTLDELGAAMHKRWIPGSRNALWRFVDFVAALRHNKMVAPMVLDGTINGASFVAYIEQCLAPTLKHGDIMAIDPAHQVPGVKEGHRSCWRNIAVSAAVLAGP
jgi:hypothetical protein